MGLVLLFILLLLLAFAAVRWGADSRDTITSQEYRKHSEYWYSFSA